MKKSLFFILAMICLAVGNAQSIISAEDKNPNDFYEKGIVVGKKAMEYPFLRESDVVWTTTIWRVIDFNEKFNQFFYFPTEAKSSQGRVSLIRLLLNAVADGAFPVYDDDDMNTPPMEIDKAFDMLKGLGYDVEVEDVDPVTGETRYDEDYEPIMVKKHVEGVFDTASVKKIMLKEIWYIDKQDSRQKVRIVGLMFQYDTPPMLDNDGREIPGTGGAAWSFCVPMNEMSVRQVLVNANAYDEYNDVVERSYDDIFIQRYFDSYIVRESNTYNREISEYLTGEDAILESQRIEEKLFELENDMWEY